MTGIKQSNWEVIFTVAAEGGGITVMGRKDDLSNWEFAIISDERTMSNLTDEFKNDELYSSVHANNWDEALQKMDQYPWTMLYPLEPFHPEFKRLIWAAIQVRGTSEHRYEDWATCCGVNDKHV